MDFVRTMLSAFLFGLIFALPLFAVHVYAKATAESAIERSDDCKDPKSRPGSRADISITQPA